MVRSELGHYRIFSALGAGTTGEMCPAGIESIGTKEGRGWTNDGRSL
jgi:hypothetical protein